MIVIVIVILIIIIIIIILIILITIIISLPGEHGELLGREVRAARAEPSLYIIIQLYAINVKL